MVKMGAREFVYPNFGYRSRWLRNRDPVYSYYYCLDKNNFYLIITFMTVRQYINKLNVRSPFASPKSRLRSRQCSVKGAAVIT